MLQSASAVTPGILTVYKSPNCGCCTKWMDHVNASELTMSVRGMPVGSPGMEHGDHQQPYDTLPFQADGQSGVFARHGE